MPEVIVNGRVLDNPLTGQPRYVRELTGRLTDRVQVVKPARRLNGIMGHMWEQSVLPLRCRGALLWSPSSTGPLAVSDQVVTIHDVAPLDHPEWFAPWFARWYGFLLPRLAKKSAHLVTISEFCKERIRHHTGVDAGKISVVPNGIDEHFRRRSPKVVGHAKRLLGIAAERYVLSLGSLEPRKNLRELLGAWEALLPQIDPSVSLVVAGTVGAGRVFADPGIDRWPDRVIRTGAVPDDLLPALYSGADVFVYPSLYEGFGLPPLEAAACGTPVVTGNGTALPEVLGDAALLVDPTDRGALTDAIRWLLNDGVARDRLSILGLRRAGMFTWDRTSEAIWSLLQDQTT